MRRGLSYNVGFGVVQDYKEALKWYRKAAKQGDASAQYALGLMYGVGQGVAQDYKEALKWYRLAAEQGNADAKQKLLIMEGNLCSPQFLYLAEQTDRK